MRLHRDQPLAPEGDPQERHRQAQQQCRRGRRSKQGRPPLAARHLPQQFDRLLVDLVAPPHDDLTRPDLVERLPDRLRGLVPPLLGLVQVQVDVRSQVDHQEVDDRLPVGAAPAAPTADLRFEIALHLIPAAIAKEVELDRFLPGLEDSHRHALEPVLEQGLLVLHDPLPKQEPGQAAQTLLELGAFVLAADLGGQHFRVAFVDSQVAALPQPPQPFGGHLLLLPPGRELGGIVSPALDLEEAPDPVLHPVGLGGVEVVQRPDVGTGLLLQLLRSRLVGDQDVAGRVIVAVRDVALAEVQTEEEARRRHDPGAGQDEEHDPDDVEFQYVVPQAGDGQPFAVAAEHAASQPLASFPPAVGPSPPRRLRRRAHRSSRRAGSEPKRASQRS